VIYDFGDDCERDFDDLAVGAFDLDARCGERLRHLHTANNAANALAVRSDDFDVVFAVEWFQSCEGFGNFHCLCTALSLFVVPKSLPANVAESSLFGYLMDSLVVWLQILYCATRFYGSSALNEMQPARCGRRIARREIDKTSFDSLL
jgi:hypothetical protein